MKRTVLGVSAALVALWIFTAPLMANPAMCPQAKPGCGMKCHGDDNFAKCPPESETAQSPEVQ